MTTLTAPPARTATRPAPASAEAGGAVRIAAHHLTRRLPDGTAILADVSVTIAAGEVVAVIGASGAGKTTLLETLAGQRRPSDGAVRYDGADVHEDPDRFRRSVGFVPQDDIVHRDLRVRATLRHAARLRLPQLDGAARNAVVEHTLSVLNLSARAGTRVGSLSGGQRKRVSIGVELLTGPRAFFLDEPTSGLDPGTARMLMATLRSLAGSRSTVVLTTHRPEDVEHCDRVLVMARGGRLVYDGPPAAALDHFGVTDLAGVYEALAAREPAPAPPASADPVTVPTGAARPETPPPPAPPRASAVHQWAALCRRDLDVLTHNRLTLAIMLGAPVAVIAMFVVLFRPGAFDGHGGDPAAAVGITYWLSFCAFFFGLTYGLLQIVTEAAVFRRERHVGLRPAAYLAAKMTVLLPVLAAVNGLMVAALGLTGRLPAAGWGDHAALLAVLAVESAAALTLGLLASAAVTDPSHATLALPMLCFPAVLFGGAVLPVPVMAAAGRAISAVTVDRWAFEAVGRIQLLGSRFEPTPAARAVLEQHGAAFQGGIAGHVLLLVAFAACFAVATTWVLDRRTRA